MGVLLQEVVAAASPGRPAIVNNFSINVATANGSGSQTSNSVLLRALFKMGLPVTGKNLFLQYPGTAHMVHHPAEQGWLPSPSRPL